MCCVDFGRLYFVDGVDFVVVVGVGFDCVLRIDVQVVQLCLQFGDVVVEVLIVGEIDFGDVEDVVVFVGFELVEQCVFYFEFGYVGDEVGYGERIVVVGYFVDDEGVFDVDYV